MYMGDANNLGERALHLGVNLFCHSRMKLIHQLYSGVRWTDDDYLPFISCHYQDLSARNQWMSTAYQTFLMKLNIFSVGYRFERLDKAKIK